MDLPNTIASSRDVFSLLKDDFNPEAEEFYAVALGPDLKILGKKMIFRGTVDQIWIHPRDIFRYAIQCNCSGLVIAHNHPSYSVKPSDQDVLQTRKLIQCGKILQIPIFDHVIFSPKDYFSFKDHKTVRF